MAKTKRATVRAFTKAVDEETREVEQIVSVFENVDLGKDRVKTGAFSDSLERWASTGDPIPVIWSHDWDNPFAHIGFVLEAKELEAGDPALPEEISELGGLYTRYKVDDAPFADQVLRLLASRRVREASFAYDVIREKRNNDGTTDLLELDVIEVGPTLKGMNPMTQLLSAKSREKVAEKAGLTLDQVNAVLDAADVKAYPSHTFLPKEGDAERCSICELTRNTVGHLNLLSAEADGSKAVVTLAGSLEETLGRFFRVAGDYAAAENLGNGGFYALHPEGTYPDDSRAVYTVEGWNDPWGEGAFFEFRFTEDEDGELVVESAIEVEIQATTRPKSRHLDAEKAKAKLTRATAAAGPSPAALLLEAFELELAG
jgi:HK97 family phage prohead protease